MSEKAKKAEKPSESKQAKEAAKRKVAIRGTIRFMLVLLNIMLFIGFLSALAELRKKSEQIVHYKKQVGACKKQAKAEGSKHWGAGLQLGVCEQNKLYTKSSARTQMSLNFEEAKRAIVILCKKNKELKAQVARRRYGGYSLGLR